ncbi:MAG: flippase-like domain-containing protein [Chloroflexi bacterium]|nr:flippase-like domain-containing protein [Chloroflexota bacterium]
MSEAAALPSQGGLRRALPGILVSLAALAALFYFIDLPAFLAALRQSDWRGFALAFVLFFGTLAARSLSWRILLQEKAGFRRAFWVLNEGYLLNNVLPFRLGEFGRALLMGRAQNLPFWEVLSTIIVERIFDVGIMAGLLLGTLPFVLGAENARTAALAAAAVMAAGFLVLFAMARNRPGTLGLFGRLAGRWPRLSAWGLPKLAAFLDGLAVLTEARRFFLVLGLLLLAWAFNVGWYGALLWGFVGPVSPVMAGFVVGASALGVALPSSPGYIGVFEAALVGALSLFGVEAAVALAFAISAHVLYLVITITLGAYGLSRDGQSLGGLYRQITKRKEREL